jgi:hypothetical protein
LRACVDDHFRQRWGITLPEDRADVMTAWKRRAKPSAASQGTNHERQSIPVVMIVNPSSTSFEQRALQTGTKIIAILRIAITIWQTRQEFRTRASLLVRTSFFRLFFEVF